MDRTTPSSVRRKHIHHKICPGHRFRLSPAQNSLATMIFWVIIIMIAIYAFHYEGRHNSCYVDRTRECLSPFYRNYPEIGDSDADLLQKIENGTRIPEERVRWRRTLLISFVIIFFTFVFTQRRVPRPIEFTIGVILAFMVIYHVESFWWMHYGYRVEQNTLRSINQLRENLGYLTPATFCGAYGPSNTSNFDWQVCTMNDDGINRGKTL